MADYIPVLTFHSLDGSRGTTSFSPALFKRSIEMLRINGFRTIRLTDAAGHVRDKKPLPEKSFVLTFDDGDRSVYDEAFPVMRACGVTATVFLATGEAKNARTDGRLAPIDGREMLGWGEIREMSEAGMDFGAHTVTHRDLTTLGQAEAEYEIAASKEIIEDKVGAPVLSFAYPYGKYDGRSLNIAERLFSCACSDRLGLVTGQSPLHALERVDAYYLRGERLFGLLLTKSFPLYIRLRDIPRSVRWRLGGR